MKSGNLILPYGRGGRLWTPAQSLDAYMASNLKEQLRAYWPLDESAGTRRDRAGIGVPNDLTDNNTVTGAAGPSIYIPLASQFTAANTEYLSRADNESISTGDIDFSIGVWVYLDSKPANNMNIIAKWNPAGGQREYRLFWGTTDRFVVEVSADGTAVTSLSAETFGAPALSTWYFIGLWHDSVGNTLNIQINAGAISSVAYANGVLSGTSTLIIGGVTETPAELWNGRIGPVAFWSRLLTDQEWTWLYNNSSGHSISQLRAA